MIPRARARVIGRRLAGALALLLALGGCAGRDFTRPPADTLRLGKTTEREIREQFGDPYRQGTVLRNGQALKSVSYGYASGTASLAGGITPARGMGYYFWNDTLAGYEFTSSFDDDKTDFDPAKAQQIRKGETTEADVTALLGPAPGAYVYPMIADQSARALVYMYAQTRGAALGLKFYQQLLIVTIAPTGVVSDVQLTTSGER